MDDAINSMKVKANKRPYIGLSQAGDKCERRIWLSNKKEYPIYYSLKTTRVFEVGTLYEKVVIKSLKKIGIKLVARQQTVFVSDKVFGHIDGLAFHNGMTKLIEIKSMNAQRFKLFQKGDLKKDFYGYYAQVCAYLKTLNLTKGLIVAICKDTEEMAIHEITADDFIATVEINKLKKLSMQETEPEALPLIGGATPLDCYYCEYKNHCNR